MNRLTMLRRYAPLAAVVAIQLLIVAAVPSRQPSQNLAAGPGGGNAVADDPLADIIGDGGLDGDGDGEADPGEPGDDGGPGGGGGGPGRSGGGDGGGTTPGGGGARVAGSAAHCVNGRQFGTDIILHPPPCVPGFGGDNGGETYRGVTAEEIRIIYYRGNLGAAVDAILTAQGSNPSDEEVNTLLRAAETWINANYELYGRQIKFILVRGQCESVPPQYDCLRNEARSIVEQHQPFGFIWNTSLASPFFDEFSKLGVVNMGGWGFRDQFAQLRRPYHYDLPLGGSQMVDLVSDWYCARMHGGGQATAEHAGDENLRQRPRVIGAISTDDPENKKTVDELNILLQRKCGAKVSHTYFYAQNIATAEQQKRAAVNSMRENPESTTVMCFCDLVAPIFLYQESQEQGYFPEHVMVTTGFMDADASAQAYGGLPSSNDGDPRGYNFDYAFGLAQLPKERPMTDNAVARLYRATGTKGPNTDHPDPHHYPSSYRDFEYLTFMATLIMGAGPNLTPTNVEAGAQRMLSSAPAGSADPHINIRSVVPANDYTWWDSVREIYWSKQPSPFNGVSGTWAPVGDGRWYRQGEFPNQLIQVPRPPR